MASKRFNGHRSWNTWNVSLWIGNDEGLYRMALDCLKRTNRNARGNRAAAERSWWIYPERGVREYKGEVLA